MYKVAPHAGAWIETSKICIAGWKKKVAPHAGAWIETDKDLSAKIGRDRSPPMRGRGLKPAEYGKNTILVLSPPMRGRGLKPGRRIDVKQIVSRPPCGGVD
ncbi:MAG: hypothetical protein SRB1_02930 [Desulfobacteraceae bacterium Eth-SRB1]|nr:MAG: hypothetical protein SRB1_02930 [Desulfobacteraceae bacterium Eth-SRB1]